MHITALIAGLALLALTVTPVAANPDWKHEGRNQGNNNGNDNGSPWRDNDNRPPWWENDNRDNDDNDNNGNDNHGPNWQNGGWGPWGPGFSGQRARRGIFQDRNDGLNDDQADALSDAFQDCVASEELREMRRGQLWLLINTIGLTDFERRHIRSRGDLSEALSDHLSSNDVQDLRMIQVLQVAHACGLNIRDLLTILQEI